jgi:hypothetical protein
MNFSNIELQVPEMLSDEERLQIAIRLSTPEKKKAAVHHHSNRPISSRAPSLEEMRQKRLLRFGSGVLKPSKRLRQSPNTVSSIRLIVDDKPERLKNLDPNRIYQIFRDEFNRLGLGKLRDPTCAVDRKKLPLGDYLWVATETDNLMPLLVEGKTIKDIVGSSCPSRRTYLKQI